MRMTFVIATLGAGGAERVLTSLAHYFSKQGHEVTVITLSASNSDFYKLDKQINRVALNLIKSTNNPFDAIKFVLRRIFALRSSIVASQPDVVISFVDRCNVLTLLACIGLHLPVIVSERTNPLYYNIGRSWSLLRRLIYKQAKFVVIQTESLREWALTHVPDQQISVIPNSLDAQRLQEVQQATPLASPTPWKKRIVTMGRFSHEKGHDLLIQSCKDILREESDWGLEIIGDGALKPELIALAQSYGISNRIYFHGRLQQPFNLIKGADIFVVPSRIEGFPNALMEAMALGVACVSFDCPSGPSDLIDNQVNGLLVPAENVEAMAHAIRALIHDEALRQQLAHNAQAIAVQFSEQSINAKWQELLDS